MTEPHACFRPPFRDRHVIRHSPAFFLLHACSPLQAVTDALPGFHVPSFLLRDRSSHPCCDRCIDPGCFLCLLSPPLTAVSLSALTAAAFSFTPPSFQQRPPLFLLAFIPIETPPLGPPSFPQRPLPLFLPHSHKDPLPFFPPSIPQRPLLKPRCLASLDITLVWYHKVAHPNSAYIDVRPLSQLCTFRHATFCLYVTPCYNSA